jgi:hypothetical protein
VPRRRAGGFNAGSPGVGVTTPAGSRPRARS